MKNEKGITLVSLMVYIVAMTMVIITVTNITRYFYANVTNSENSTKYYEQYLKFLSYITEEVNVSENYILVSDIEYENDDENSDVVQKYIIFSKTYNQYTFKNNEIYKNSNPICDNVKDCTFTSLEDGKKIRINITMEDGKKYDVTYKIRSY